MAPTQKVDVQLVDALTAGLAVVHDEAIAVKAKVLGHFRCRQHQVAEQLRVLRRSLGHTGDVSLRN
jgi:hypothetical protein